MADKKSNHGKFLDADSGYQSGSDDYYSIRYIVMSHVTRIMTLASKEFRGGYWQTKVHTSGGTSVATTEKVYVPDTREEYCNAIQALWDITFPHQDEESLKETKEILEEIEKARTDCLNNTEKEDVEILQSDYYGKEDKRLLEEYKILNVRLHRKLFRRLSTFLKANNYYESSGIIEGL